MAKKNLPVRKTMCGTCPFRPGSQYAYLAEQLGRSAMSEASRICHSTGSSAIVRRSGLPPHLCRGARDLQLKAMTALRVIEEPTDEAWNKKRAEIGMEPQVIADPKKK